MRFAIRDFCRFKNKAKFVLFFSCIYLFSLSLPLFASSPASTQFLQNCKTQFTTQKTFHSINYNADSTLSIDDIEMDDICISSYRILICLINSVDNQSLFIKDCQSRMQLHVPLFLKYQDIRR